LPTSHLSSSSALRLLALVVVAGLMLSSGLATSATAGARMEPPNPAPDTDGGADDAAAVDLLAQATAAERTVAYVGTQFVAVWRGPSSSSELVDLTNLPNKGTVVRVRAGETTPGADQARFVTARSAAETDRLGDGTSTLADTYVVTVAGTARSVGRPATVVEAHTDAGAIAARFWIDDQTGLLLRRELYAADGTLERASAFVDLSVRADVFVSHLPPMLERVAGLKVEPAAYTDLTAAGWTCCAPEVAGELALTDVRRSADGTSLHLAYSDGLTTASVFEQRGRLDASSLEGFAEVGTGKARHYVRYGLSSYAVWASGDTVYTAVSDTPRGLEALVAAFPHNGTDSEATGDGLGQRLDRGLTRMVSWLNPFD
jgi:sigma-E factor negative regulatory protein RseB